MKKIIILCLFCLGITGYATATTGLDFHLGLGYHSSYFETNLDSVYDDFENLIMPLGVGGYAGLGFSVGAFNAGVEFAPSLDVEIAYPIQSTLNMQLRGYGKFQFLANMLTATAFFGYTFNNITDTTFGTPIAGARLTLLMLYLDYAMNLESDFSNIAKHELGLGVTIFR